MRQLVGVTMLLSLVPSVVAAQADDPLSTTVQSPFYAGHATMSAASLGPAELPPTRLSYRVDVQLEPSTRALTGDVVLAWTSPASEPLYQVPVHLYLNAFRHEATTWMDGIGAIGRLDFDAERATRLYGDPWGFIDLERVAQRLEDGSERELVSTPIQPDDGNPLDRSLVRVDLAESVEPDATLVLVFRFRAQLPIPIARTGGLDDYFHAGQWLPKIGVYEPVGVRGATTGRWAARQFHGPTEFYADFADWDVAIDVPESFDVVATGREQPLGGVAPAPGRRRVRFTQRAVHDFTFVAARDLHIETHEYTPAGGGPTIAITYVTQKVTSVNVGRMRTAAEKAFDVLGARVGPYPYATMTIVEPPFKAWNTAGMEYPTLVTGAPGDPLLGWIPRRYSEEVIGHEIAHNYFQGMLASDEQREAFLDEGFTQFYDTAITAELSTHDGWNSIARLPHRPLDQLRSRVASASSKMRVGLNRSPSNLYLQGTFGSQIYARPCLTLTTAERMFGREAVDRVLATYFRRWRFRHPSSEDFFAVVDEVGPKPLASFLREAMNAPMAPDYAIDDVETERWFPPRGWIETTQGRTQITSRDDPSNDAVELGLDPAEREAAGQVLVEIIDPDPVDDHGRLEGRVERRLLELVADESRSAAAAADGDDLYLTTVRLTGPGWSSLPVDVVLRFADGAVIRDRWDGRATWRRYRILRPSALVAIRIDPDDVVVLDSDPSNNGRILEPETELGDGVAAWLGMLAQWLTLGFAGL